MSNTTAITAACTCTVDGISGLADTRYNGYSFTGCGAHLDYHYELEGAGYDKVWCYVTSPDECNGFAPYVPEGFFTDNTLPEWKADGAAWKKCYEGYRCEAWWGTLDGTPIGDPIPLAAPLDWPDCCARCSENNGDDEAIGETLEECTAWSFDPSTGSCQLMSAVLSTDDQIGWNETSTIHGYPGFFEPPVDDCWNRGGYDLCQNASLGFLIPGIIWILAAMVCIVCCRKNLEPDAAKDFFEGTGACLEKAACVRVEAKCEITSSGKGGVHAEYVGGWHSLLVAIVSFCCPAVLTVVGEGYKSSISAKLISQKQVRYKTRYTGTFVTRTGSLVKLPYSRTRRWTTTTPPTTFKRREKTLLEVLFNSNMDPFGDVSSRTTGTQMESIPREGSTVEGRRKHLNALRKISKGHKKQPGVAVVGNSIEEDGGKGIAPEHREFNCLLLVGPEASSSAALSATDLSAREVCLVGVLGEDKIDFLDDRELPLSPSVLLLCMLPGLACLISLCVLLLTNDAAQIMASWTFRGTSYRAGAIAGLILTLCVPAAWAWRSWSVRRDIRSMVLKMSPAVRPLS